MIKFQSERLNESKNPRSTHKPPYLIGLLGFVPLVGFFVGIFIIIVGIAKYKDRKLTLIGIGCMIFTVVVYSSLYYVGFESDFGKKNWAEHAQMELNSLPKYVEFYKMEHGKYPDSLKQLENEDEFIFIVDPTQKEDKDNPKYFNYKNLGDRYLLFSSGIDRKPNTKDDLYPKIKMNDKIGWTKTE